MIEVIEIDRLAAAAYMKLIGDNRWTQHGILSGGCDNTSVVQAFAAHRIAAEKAVLDRLRGWTDDDHEYLGTGITQAQANTLADALETKP